MNFAEARAAVGARLADLYEDGRESPRILAYGWDTGRAWAPMVDWDGVMGTYVYLVDKRTGAMRPVSFPEFEDMPTPTRVGVWPKDIA